MTNIKRQLQIQYDEEQQEEVDDQSPGPGLKRARHNNSTETRASPDTNLLNEEEHIGAEPEHDVNDDPPLIRHRRHFVISDSDTDLSSAEETDISDRGIASDHIYGARREDDDNVIADQPPSFEDQNERNVAGASNRKPVLTTPPATPSVASEAGSSIQWPVLLTKSDMPSTEEVVTSRQKSRAIKKELADAGLTESTAWCYSQYLCRWETFCNKFYRGDGTLTSEKIHHFFKDDMFVGKPTTVMVEDKRNIVIGVTKHDPSVHPTEASAEAAMIRSRFEAAMRESNISARYFILPRPESCILAAIAALSYEDGRQTVRTNRALKPTSAHHVRNIINVYNRSLVRRSENRGASGATKEQGASTSEVRQLARSEQQTVVPGRSQKKVQNSREVSFSGRRPAPTLTAKPGTSSGAKPVPSSINKTATKSIPKPGDSLDSFIRTMGTFLARKTIAHGTHSPGIRNRAVFALERQLLVPYQDLVALDLVDSFTEHFDITHNGSTCNVPGLAICVRSGQPLPDHESPVVVALRHKDYRSCAVGAVAFHFFDRFQLRGEPFPDFKNVSKWPRTKLFRNMEIFEPTSVRAVEEAIRVTLIASGVKDRGLAQSDGAIRDLAGLGIRVEGPMKMGSHGETPRGLAALSGYHNEPYKLRRDVIPPLELQRQIFPMIENQYGSMDPAQWRAYCDEVMKDPSASPGLGLKQGAARLRRLEAAQENMDEYLAVARLDLLHIFLWLRRIVLQDMALFIRENSRSDLVRHKVFASRGFVRFQADLVERMEGNVPIPSQDQGSASGSSPTVQRDRRNSGASSKAPASHDRPERRHIGSRQHLLDEQSQEADKTSSNDPMHSGQDIHEDDRDDRRVDSEGLQLWIDRDRIRQQQAHTSLSDLLQREQDRQQKPRERELRRIQQDHAQDKAHIMGRIVRMEQKLDQQSEQLRSIRQRLVQQDEYIKDLEKAQRDELLELECQVTTQADQITWREQRLQQLEEERNNRRQEQLRQRQRGLDQRALERQQQGSHPSGVKMRRGTWEGAQRSRDTGVATGLKAVARSPGNVEARMPGLRVSEAILLDDDDDKRKE